MMRSLFVRLVAWTVATILLTSLGLVATLVSLSDRFRGPDEFVARTHAWQLELAQRAFDEGGAPRLARFLADLDARFEARYSLTDARGRDYLTGQIVDAAPGQRDAPDRRVVARDGRIALVYGSASDRSRLVIVIRPRPVLWNLIPRFAWFPFLIAALCFLLARYILSPIRRLRGAVERFGEGELTTRVRSRRADEIGDLSRTFDRMADRIESLVTSERRLLQDVSHELRSPLTRLGFGVELARTARNPQEALDRVQEEADQLATLVGELLQLRGEEIERSARDWHPVDLGELLQAVVRESAIEAERRPCRLILRVESPSIVTGNPKLLRRAVGNVLRNAIRHTGSGTTVELVVRAEQDGVLLSIRDHGPGVPPEAFGLLFEPFYRVDPALAPSDRGTGLGLAIARRAVNLHRGTIEARNADPGLEVVIRFGGEHREVACARSDGHRDLGEGKATE